MASGTLRPLLEPLLFDFVKWTAESLMPSWQRRSVPTRSAQTYSSGIGPLEICWPEPRLLFRSTWRETQLFKPFLADDEGRRFLYLLASRTGPYVAMSLMPPRFLKTLSPYWTTVSRACCRIGPSTKELACWRGPWSCDARADCRAFVLNVENAPGAARYVNGDWSQIDTVLPIIDRMVRNVGWSSYVMGSSSTFASGLAGPIRFPSSVCKRTRRLRRSATPRKDGPARCCQREWPVWYSGRPTGIP